MARGALASGSSSESWVYLVNWIMAVILGLAFVFYFARLVGYILTLLSRVVIPSRYKVRVSVGAFRISPLGGRVSAKNIVVSTADYTVSIIRLNITWRYWLFKMTRVPRIFLRADAEAGLTPAANAALSTSYHAQIDGLEVFMYNRTVAYDGILETLRAAPPDAKGTARHRFSSESASSSGSGSSASPEPAPAAQPQPAAASARWLLSVLPLQINVKRGAFVLGNHSTPSILVASFKAAVAVLDVSAAASPADVHRTALDVAMEKFQVALKPNISYDPHSYGPPAADTKPPRRDRAPPQRLARAMRSLTRLLPRALRRREPPQAQPWHGLRRYVGDFEKDRIIELNEVEDYAKYSLVLDSVSTQMVYYYDVPGVHTKDAAGGAPEFGVDLVVSMATIHYGPWAERQRGPLQAMLFPTLARDSEPTPAGAGAGAARTYAGFNFSLATRDEIILRVPTREFSKDKEELAHVADDPKQQNNTRPFGWLELKLGAASSLACFNSYVASPQGWPNTVSMHLADLEVRTSVTHDILFSAESHRMACDVGFPLKWNGACAWSFDMQSANGRLFFLHEHLTLFTDLVADFAAGPPANYESYRPFTYTVRWTIDNYRLFFNVNDHNVINDTLDFDSNKYVCFSGDRLDISSTIPVMGSFTACTKVDYRIYTPRLSLSLEVPPWHTVSAFMDASNQMGSSDAFEVSGYYNFYRKIEVDHHNYAVINAVGDNVTMLFYGYFVRYLFTFRENFFGDNISFTTFEEYVMGNCNDDHVPSTGPADKPDPDYWNMLKTENDLGVLFTFSVRRGLLVLPAQTFDHASHIGFVFDSLDVEINHNPLYFDLQANASTANGYMIGADAMPSCTVFDLAAYELAVSQRNVDLVIDDLSVHTHRMLGVDDLVYQCKWDFAMGSMVVDSDPLCLTGVSAALSNFILGFKDLENTLIYNVPTVYDAANFTFRCPEISVNIRANADTHLHVKIEDLLVAMNDIANHRYSSRISVSVPSIVAQIVNSKNTYDAHFKTSLMITNITQKAQMLEHRRSQQAHVRRNDATTHRAAHLLFPDSKDETYMNALGSMFSSVSVPSVPHPLTKEYASLHRGSDSSGSSVCSEKDESGCHPTTEYYDEDFRPQAQPDPEYIYESFILEVGPVQAFVSPAGLEAVSDVAVGRENFDLAALVDRLQFETVQRLMNLLFARQTVDNVRLVCPTFDVRISDQAVSSPEAIFCTSPKVPVVAVSMMEPSLAFSSRVLRARDGAILNERKSSKLAAHVKEVYVSLFLPGHFSSAANCVLTDIEAWLTSDEEENVVSFVELGDSRVSFDTFLLESALQFVKETLAQLQKPLSNFSSASWRAQRWRAEVAKRLTLFAKNNGLQSDPRVLTKPARILRSSSDHVRFYEDWKLMTKLRSIANQLIGSSDERQVLEIGSHDTDDFLGVMSYFESWRAWEGNMAQRERFFSNLFGELATKSGNATVFVKFNQFDVSITEKGVQSTCFVLKNMALEWKKLVPRATDMPEEELTRNSIVLNTEEIDLSLTPESFSAIAILKGSNLFETEKRSEGDISGTERIESQSETPGILDFTFGLKYLRCNLALCQTAWAVYAYNTSASVLYSPLDGHTLSSALNMRELGISFDKDDLEFFSWDMKNFSTIAAGGESGGAFTLAVDSALGDSQLRISDPANELCPTLAVFLSEDVEKLKALFKSEEPGSASEPNLSDLFSKLPPIKANVFVANFDYLIEALNPVIISGTLKNSETKVDVSPEEITTVFAYKSSLVDIKLLDLTIVRAENSGSGARFSVTENTTLLVDAALALGYLKVTTPQLSKCMDSVFTKLPIIEQRLDDLRALVPKQKQERQQTQTQKQEQEQEQEQEQTQKEGSMFESVLFQLQVTQTYWGWSTYNNRCLYTVEFERLHSNLSNFDDGGVVPVHGEIRVPSTRITLVDPSFPVGLSTLLDVNIGVKVMNDEGPTSSLQIESEHFRVCLSPPVVLKLLEATSSMKATFSKHPKIFEKAPGSPRQPRAEDESDLAVPAARPTFSSIHVLSHNFCIGWLFNTSHKDYPGLIVGAERVFAVAKANKGKLTLMDGCLSVAHGSTASSFYSQSPQEHNLNRAFMPKLQLNYFMDDKRKLWVSLKGDELDVRFMTNSVVVAERTMQSIAQIRKYLEQAARKPKEKEVVPCEKKEGSAASRFAAVECNIGFAGSRTLIYKLEADASKAPPSLSLNSPAVQIVVGYRLEKHAAKKHVIRTEIMVSGSDNTVYSSCVPVIVDLVDKFKSLFKDSSEAPSESKAERSVVAGENEMEQALRDIDFHVGVIVEKQSFSLSCEPLAKVAAIVKFNGASMIACTGIESTESIYLFAKLDSIAASLQHIYSDERSGSIDVQSVVFSSKVGFSPDIEVVSSCCVSDISGNVKMKQYQDVDLFGDIWYPEKYRRKPSGPDKKTAKSRAVSQKAYKAAVPVTLDFIVANTSLEIDFGSALGVMSLEVDKVWALSRQTSGWCYDFKFGIETLAVQCEGRLGGLVKIKKLFLNSAIEWKLGDASLLTVPLVHMSGGLEHFYFRTVFDEHLFAFGSFQGWKMDVFNRKDGVNISKDHMFVSVHYDNVELFLTSLAASDFFDIYSTVSRMVEEKRTSYREILEDSNENGRLAEEPSTLLEIAKKLETKIEVRTGVTRLQVYPHSFHDSKTLVIELDRSSANFTQNEYDKGVVNEIELQLNNVNASFASTAGTTPEAVRGSTVAQLIEYARKAKGGSILGLPKFMISMRTFQEYHTKDVEYLFQSSFGGTVDIRWNLGSVNCVREMYAAHKRALLSRTEMYKNASGGSGFDLQQQLAEETEKLHGAPAPAPAESDTRTGAAGASGGDKFNYKEIDKDIRDTMEKVASTSKFRYTALAPPVIEAPKLKELGSATPPLEWFGLHRNKFPDATHQLAIVTLQRLIHEIEQEYTKVLGKTVENG